MLAKERGCESYYEDEKNKNIINGSNNYYYAVSNKHMLCNISRTNNCR